MIQALFPTEQQATILLHNDPGSGECCSLVMPHKSAGTRPSGYPYSFGEGKSATGQQHPEQDHRLGIFSMVAEMGRDLISQRVRKRYASRRNRSYARSAQRAWQEQAEEVHRATLPHNRSEFPHGLRKHGMKMAKATRQRDSIERGS